MARNSFFQMIQGRRPTRGLIWGLLIIAALFAFEVFNYSTTDFAMTDLLGDLRFMGIRWATILAIAFCGIDFAGIARLFTPEQGADEPMEVWYLFGAWLLAATMNALLTWWGVSIAIVSHDTLGNAVVARETLLKVVPVFVAIMVWLMRVLIIGTFSVAGERLFSQDHSRSSRFSNAPRRSAPARQAPRPAYNSRPNGNLSRPATQASFRPVPKRQEPTYHPVGLNARSNNNSNQGGYGDPMG
ncbi:MAG: hypothetical protein EPO32_08380 [Anaerolineae bacterium]|nr:MAG: hypothetical protein EPO32_08380 [Anaerolineae bacterium]